jgi:hypothetical protein
VLYLKDYLAGFEAAQQERLSQSNTAHSTINFDRPDLGEVEQWQRFLLPQFDVLGDLIGAYKDLSTPEELNRLSMRLKRNRTRTGFMLETAADDNNDGTSNARPDLHSRIVRFHHLRSYANIYEQRIARDTAVDDMEESYRAFVRKEIVFVSPYDYDSTGKLLPEVERLVDQFAKSLGIGISILELEEHCNHREKSALAAVAPKLFKQIPNDTIPNLGTHLDNFEVLNCLTDIKGHFDNIQAVIDGYLWGQNCTSSEAPNEPPSPRLEAAAAALNQISQQSTPTTQSIGPCHDHGNRSICGTQDQQQIPSQSDQVHYSMLLQATQNDLPMVNSRQHGYPLLSSTPFTEAVNAGGIRRKLPKVFALALAQWRSLYLLPPIRRYIIAITHLHIARS